MTDSTRAVRVLHLAESGAAADALAVAASDTAATVRTVERVADALAAVTEDSTDCLITGFDLADGDAFDLLEAIGSRGETVPVVVFTAAGEESTAGDLVAAGASGYVPFSGDPSDAAARALDRAAAAVADAEETARLRRTQRVFDAVFDNPAAFMAVLSPDGTVLRVNEAARMFVDAEPDTPVGKPFPETAWWDHSPSLQEDLRAWIAQAADGERVDFQADHYAPDGDRVLIEGSLYPVTDGDGTVVSLVAAGRDVTERETRRRYLEAIVEATTQEAIYIKDTEGRYQFINRAGAAVFGRSPEDVLGRRAGDLYDEESDGQLPVDRRVLEEETSVSYEVTRVVDGEDHHFMAEKHPYYEDDTLRGLVGISRDITERKRQEAALERQNERLEEFASVVSHDLRNPLNVASGRLELARADCDCEHLDAVERSHRRMEALIDDLLTLARYGQTTLDPAPVALDSAARAAWENVDTGPAVLRVETTRTVEAEEGQLLQVLENLFRNSLEHGSASDPSGADDCTTRDDDTVTITVGDCSGGFYVADDGPGIPADDRETVFEAGYTTDDDGTGFGLAIVKRIADAHGWTVEATESAAGGARFEFTGVRGSGADERPAGGGCRRAKNTE